MIEVRSPGGVDIGYLTTDDWGDDGYFDVWDGWLVYGASFTDALVANGVDEGSARRAVLREALKRTEDDGAYPREAAVRIWLRQQLTVPCPG
jgi:hypothetical protein